MRQQSSHYTRSIPLSSWFVFWWLMAGAATVADMLSTWLALSLGLHEGNVIFALLGQLPPHQPLLYFAIGKLAVFLLLLLPYRFSPRVGEWAVIVATCLFWAPVISNILSIVVYVSVIGR